MAREPSVLDDDDSVSSADLTPGNGGNTSLLGRRTYLKVAGAAAAATAGAAAAGSAAADAEYDVVELDPGERRVVEVGSGETLENKLYDQSASGAQVVITAYGTNWTIRNVGIRGKSSEKNAQFGVADTGGGTSTIENVYLGDGAEAGHRIGLGIWVSPEHDGHLDIERVNIQEMGDNSFYCSAPGDRGTVHIDRCYSANSWVSHYRLAKGKVTNSVAVNDGRHRDGRGVWAWGPGPVEVENCQFVMNGRHYSVVAGANNRGSRVSVSNTRYDTGFHGGIRRAHGSNVSLADGNGTDPEDVVPEGCPTSPEEAAAGGSSDPVATEEDPDDEPATDLEHVLLIDGDGTSEITRYEFVVDGTVEKSTHEGASIDDEDVIDGGHVHGAVAGWRDAFRFEGDLEQLTVDGPATVYLDDEEIDPADYGEDLPHVLEVEGQGASSSYEITVDGEIALDGDEEPKEEVTIVSGTTVESSILDGTQRFSFSGEITDVTVTGGDVRLLVDGEAVDPAEYGDGELLPHAIVVDGRESTDPSTYSFRVDGTVVKSDYAGASIDDGDIIEGGAVRGAVANWLDAYWFAGDVSDLVVLGDASVRIEYNARDR